MSKSCIWVGECTHELQWVYEKLQTLLPVLRLDSDSQRHAFGKSLQPSWVLIGSRSRTDQLESLHAECSALWPNSQILAVLGSWWPGHRRCHPLPESWQTRYWYELWDGILTDIAKTNESQVVPSKVAPRLARLIGNCNYSASTNPRLALVTTHSAMQFDFWKTLLPELSLLPVCRLVGGEIPQGDFEINIVDWTTASPPSNGTDVGYDEIRRLRRNFSRAKLIVRTNFPDYAEWIRLEEAGADTLLQGLFHLPGFVEQTNMLAS